MTESLALYEVDENASNPNLKQALLVLITLPVWADWTSTLTTMTGSAGSSVGFRDKCRAARNNAPAGTIFKFSDFPIANEAVTGSPITLDGNGSI